jgi:hypothetical protein
MVRRTAGGASSRLVVRENWKGDPMGTSTAVIVKVSTPEYAQVVIETSDGVLYQADLSSFESVYCFPKTPEQWSAVSQDDAGLALVWTSRFEVHVDQVMALATRVEHRRQTA